MEAHTLQNGASSSLLTPGASVAKIPGNAATAVTDGRTLDVHYVINQLVAGGAEQSLAELVSPLAERGIRLSVWCLEASDEEWSGVGNPPWKVQSLGSGSLASKAMRLRRELRRRRVDVLHTTLYEADLVGRAASVGTGIPVLTSLVNTTYDRVRLDDPNVTRWKLALAKRIEGWSARALTTHFHAISQAVKDSYVRHLDLPAERITVIPRGRTSERLGAPSLERRRRARLALGLPSDAEVVVSVGRQEFQKGHVHLLEATALLAPRRPDLVTLIAGRPGHATSRLVRRHRELGLGDRLRFLGHRDDVPELLVAADVFAFPSLYEGLGGAVIEAMAMGLPIVCSDLPALREVVEEGGNALLVPSAGPGALAAAMNTLLEDEAERAAFGSRSRSIFLQRFRIDECAAAHADLYRRMAA